MLEEIKLKGEGMAGIYKDIAEIAGEEAAKALYRNFRGQQVVFPNKLYSSTYTTQKIREEFNGKNVKELALKYGFTERWVRTLLKTKSEKSVK